MLLLLTLNKVTHKYQNIVDIKPWSTLIAKACNFIKKKLQHRCVPVNTAKFLKTLIWRTSATDCFCKRPVSIDFSLCIIAKKKQSDYNGGLLISKFQENGFFLNWAISKRTYLSEVFLNLADICRNLGSKDHLKHTFRSKRLKRLSQKYFKPFDSQFSWIRLELQNVHLSSFRLTVNVHNFIRTFVLAY